MPAICNTSVKVVYVSIKSPLIGEHAFPLTEVIGWLACVSHCQRHIINSNKAWLLFVQWHFCICLRPRSLEMNTKGHS